MYLVQSNPICALALTCRVVGVSSVQRTLMHLCSSEVAFPPTNVIFERAAQKYI